MCKYLILVFLFTSFITNAEETCNSYKNKSYLSINKREINLKHSLYSDISGLYNLVQSDFKSNIVRKISKSSNPMYKVKVLCTDDLNIFFSVYIGDLKVAFMDGVIIMESARYYSGPHSLINPDDKVVIIQADKQ
jgi:hypothetical protein